MDSCQPHWSDHALDLIAHRFKLLAEPSRLRLLYALFNGEMTVGELANNTCLNQANVSQQLAMLADGGLIARRKEGCRILYRLADPSVQRLSDLVCRGLQQRGQLLLDALDDTKMMP